jgi:hypothetical protein
MPLIQGVDGVMSVDLTHFMNWFKEGKMEIRLECGQFIIGEYSIAGNYDDGYTVWRTDDGEDSETLYGNISFECCVVWCLNS